MPTEPLYPGVFIEEISSGVHTITGVPTAITAFIGRAVIGPTQAPSLVTSFVDFERLYGGLSSDCPLSYAVQHFFDNGGAQAVIARIVHRATDGTLDETAPITDADITDPSLEPNHAGLWLLDQADTVNILCIPPLGPATDVARATWDAAIAYAHSRLAFVIVDPPAIWATAADAANGVEQLATRDSNAALYFPRIVREDPLAADNPAAFAPCGTIAGLYARTDTARGVWKAPAGVDAALSAVTGLATTLNDSDNGTLNPLAVNCLRNFPVYGRVAWGARTLAGSDVLASDWKYVPVRRTALMIEDSLYRGTRWAASEPNAEPLWAALRLSVGAFMQELFRQGAFQGSTPREAYFVKCDADTTTEEDVTLGIANLVVGFAPLRPAEFVLLKLAVRTADPSL
jgi:phage tail sheath protein FI